MKLNATCARALMVVLATTPAAWATVASPVFDPEYGDSAVVFPVTVTCATSGATIRYTLNGSEPTTSDPIVASGATITIARKVVLRAKAWSGSETSTTTSAEYRLTGDVAAGAHHVLSLSSSGEVKAWGEQLSGRLGNGLATTANVTSPVASKSGANSPITDALAIGAAQNHSLVLRKQTGDIGVWNSVYSFGDNASGELGDNSTVAKSYAVRVKTGATTYLNNCQMVRAGDNFSGALGEDGKVYMWGSQGGGKLGNGLASGNKLTAGVVKIDAGNELSNIVSLSLGSACTLARDASGSAWSWGWGTNGRLGQGSATNQPYAAKVKMSAAAGDVLTGAYDISAGGTHSVVVRKIGGENYTVWAFGDASQGRLGNNNTTTDKLYPDRVKKAENNANLDNIRMVAAGSAHTLALDHNGLVWAWGYNGYGAIGNDDRPNNATRAVQVLNPSGNGQLGDDEEGEIVWIAAGGDGGNNTSYAISERGVIYAWGRNDDGELASGSVSASRDKPAAVANLKMIPAYPDVGLVHTINDDLSPGNVTLTATPDDQDGPANIAKVEFYSQGVEVGEVAYPGPYQHVLTGLAAGNYHVYAVVTDDEGNQGQSSPVSFTIRQSNPNSDNDGDGLTFAEEDLLGTDPEDPDSDGDKMGDGYEKYYGLAPLSAANGGGSNLGPNEDKDSDEISNKDEADRGRLANSETESPAIEGSFPATMHAKWFGVAGVTYHFEHLTGGTTWTRHPVPLAGSNAELVLPISDVVSSLPVPFNTRIVADSDAPEVSLAATVTDPVNPGKVFLEATATDPDGSLDIDKVDFYVNDVHRATITHSPWEVSIDSLAEGSYQAYAIVTDRSEKRGFSVPVNFSINAPEPEADDDLDGMPDEWEILHFGSLNAVAGGDEDGDQVTNAAELANGTNPNDIDSDGDGIPDNLDGNPLVADKVDFPAASLLVISPLQ